MKSDKQAAKEAAKLAKEAEAATLVMQEGGPRIGNRGHGLNIWPNESRSGQKAITMTMRRICTLAELYGVVALNHQALHNLHHWQRFALLT
ncbi:MAG: hypothetical protein ACXWT1_01280 [Methylobacter sp.]